MYLLINYATELCHILWWKELPSRKGCRRCIYYVVCDCNIYSSVAADIDQNWLGRACYLVYFRTEKAKNEHTTC